MSTTPMETNYRLLREARDEAQKHAELCLIRHDDESFRYWNKIREDISVDMLRVYKEIAKHYKP